MRKRRLDRAIVLGLILSTSIYGTSFASTGTVSLDIQNLREQAEQSIDGIVRINEDTTINGSHKNEYASIFDENKNTLSEIKEIQVAEGSTFTINGVIMNSPNITGNGDIVVNVGKPSSDGGNYQTAGIFVNGIIKGNSLTINNKDYEDSSYGKGIYAYGKTDYNMLNDGNITVDVDNAATIKSYSDGIFTTTDVPTNVGVTAGQITIDTTTRNGIYVGGPSDYANRIELTSESGDISIKSGGTDIDEAGVKNKAEEGIVKLDSAKNITIDSAGQGIYTTAGTTILTTQNGGNINISGDRNAVYNHGGIITISAKKPVSGMSTFADYDDTDNTLTGEENGIKSDSTGSTTVEADNNNTIAGDVNGILSDAAGTIDVTAGNNNTIGQYTDDESETIYTSQIGINAIEGTITVTSENGQNSIYGEKYGIRAGDEDSTGKLESSIKVEATKGNNVINVKGFYDSNGFDKDSGDGINVTANSTGTIALTANKGNNEINAIDDGIYVDTGSTKKVTLTAENNTITAGNNGIDYRGSDDGEPENGVELLEIKATTGANIIKAGVSKVLGNPVGTDDNEDGYRDDKDGDGIRTQGRNGTVEVTAGTYNDIAVRDTGLYIDDESDNSKISLTANGTKEETENYSNRISAQENGVQIDGTNSEIDVKSVSAGNIINAKNIAVYNTGNNSAINIDANSSNMLIAGNVSTVNNQDYADGHAIQAENNSTVNVNAASGDNNVFGVIYAKGVTETADSIEVTNAPTINLKHETSGSNYIYSSAHGTDDNGARSNVVSALYAQNSGVINVTAGQGGVNHIETNATLSDGQIEQTVWAQQGGKIYIDGKTTIVASNADVNTNNIDGNSLGIAITAGTGDISGLEELPPLNTTQDGNEIRSTVNITNASGSSITGDIVSGYGGLINIGMDVNNKTRAAGTVENIKITGNALAANGGKLNINLGNGGTWTGRADDYGDAGYGPDAENHQNFYNPAFSNDILEGGTVNLTMGDNSTWKVQGQSWITSVDTTNAQNATIDLVEANTDRNTTSHALTIYDLKGNANINMNLDGDRDVSDMLYVKNAQGEYNVALADAVTTEDMYANGLDGLRFATVGAGSNVKFNAGSYDAGVFNVEYEVGTDAYDGNDENVVYNGNSLDVEKPGTSTVDSFFRYQEEDPNAEENTSEIATYARMAEEPQVMALAEEPATETTATTKEATATGATNYKLIARKGESLSDAGKTILNMSKANYSQAVYLDTLNKRLGEARYLEGDEGLWVRMRHDKIDKDSSYEITNNMYELGYDKKYESKDKNGYHRKGVVIDYMDGDTSYDNIAGSGETNRKGIWLYDTWIGNKGHYTDYVAKWGHLENSFDLYTKTRGEKVSGEYDNDVYSLSAEWGYKDQLNNDWYIEPQVQLQYARVTGADYETSQGTQVSVDGIDSLIARAGFRLGKDFGEEKKSTFYVKADVLHEFLGDQDITAIDKTTDGKLVSIGYDNDGTWYSVGLGFSTMLSDNSYAFLDVEKIFGNDNDNSYQINGGFNWLL